jgi:archaellin
MEFRTDYASAALPLTLLLIVVIFITLTATSMITDETTTSQEELQKYVDDAVNDLTSYLKIQHVYGEYSKQKPYYLTKIAIQTTPLFNKQINISTWTVQIHTKSSLQPFHYNFTSSKLIHSSVFSHPLWSQLKPNNFGILSIQDKDESLINYHSFTDSSDVAFFTLSVENLSINKHDYVTLLLTPGVGVEKTISFQVPLPTNQVILLW